MGFDSSEMLLASVVVSVAPYAAMAAWEELRACLCRMRA